MGIFLEFVRCIESCYQNKKKMGDFIELGTHRGTNIRVKIETQKKSEMYFSYCIESKDFIYAFLTAQLNRTLMKKIINMKDTQKCTKYQEI